MMLSQSAIEMAPPFELVSKFFIAGMAILVLSISALPFLNYELPLMAMESAGFIHFYLLGFVMMIILGALYQLIPVVLEVPFFTLKGANALFYLYLIGTLLLSGGMMSGQNALMHAGGGLVYLCFLYFTTMFLLSFLRVERWTLVSLYLLMAGVFLITAVSLGMATLLSMTGIDLGFDVMYLFSRHASFALVGFVMLVVIGVSLVLLPMFSLAHNFSTIFAKIALGVFIVAFFTALFSSNDLFAWGLMAIGLFLYLIQSIHILTSRMRKQNDYWIGNLAVAYLFLFAFLTVGGYGYFNENETLIKVAFIFAVIGFGFHFVLGHMYKILPFLIWYKYVSPLVGKQKVPMLHEMIEDKAAYAQMWLGFVGTILLSLGIALHVKLVSTLGAVLLAIAAWFALYNVWVAYKFKNIGEKNDN